MSEAITNLQAIVASQAEENAVLTYQRDEAFKLLERLEALHGPNRPAGDGMYMIRADFRTLKANAEGNMPHTAKLADPPSN